MTSPLIHWRNAAQHYHLIGQQCTSCKKLFFPRAYVCTCGASSFNPYQLTGKGTIASFTRVTSPTPEFAHAVPYILALIDLDEGIRILGQLTDVDIAQLCIGARITKIFRRLYADGEKGIIHYGIKFMLQTNQ